MQQSTHSILKTPEAYQKRNGGVNSREEEDMLAKRMFHVDTLHVNKEKKLLFEKVPNDYDYFPFGAPG